MNLNFSIYQSNCFYIAGHFFTGKELLYLYTREDVNPNFLKNKGGRRRKVCDMMASSNNH